MPILCNEKLRAGFAKIKARAYSHRSAVADRCAANKKSATELWLAITPRYLAGAARINGRQIPCITSRR
jgi:hypothetical protein